MKDRLFKIGLYLAGACILLLVSGIFYSLFINSLPAFKQFGFIEFISSSNWDSREGVELYGAFPFVIGSFLVAILAIIIAIPFSLSLSMLCGTYFYRRKSYSFINFFVDLAAKVPAIVWAVWGFYCIRPILSFFNVDNFGLSILTTSIVLAIMIIPYAASLSIRYVKKVPLYIKEAAYSLGATKMQIMMNINMPFAKNGIIYAHLLALSKVLGEAMIVTILVGNSNKTPNSIVDTGNTISSLFIDQFISADNLRLSALFALALLLFVFTVVINTIGTYLLRKERLGTKLFFN